ncbi:MAG: hypothetical protein AAFN74_08685 [Myxococcota bacterium]
MALPLVDRLWLVDGMGGSKKDEPESRIDDEEAKELMRDAAEGLAQVPSLSSVEEPVTLPGIPLDALELDANEPTQKIPALLPPKSDATTSEEDAEATETEVSEPATGEEV